MNLNRRRIFGLVAGAAAAIPFVGKAIAGGEMPNVAPEVGFAQQGESLYSAFAPLTWGRQFEPYEAEGAPCWVGVSFPSLFAPACVATMIERDDGTLAINTKYFAPASYEPRFSKWKGVDVCHFSGDTIVNRVELFAYVARETEHCGVKGIAYDSNEYHRTKLIGDAIGVNLPWITTGPWHSGGVDFSAASTDLVDRFMAGSAETQYNPLTMESFMHVRKFSDANGKPYIGARQSGEHTTSGFVASVYANAARLRAKAA